jgi:stage III sporulation protein SpoIIIAA
MLIADDLDQLLEILPSFIKTTLEVHPNRKNLIEIVMDLGRRPEARFPSGPEYLSNRTISWYDLDYAIKRVGNFSGDNRSGIERTLHRISSIKNRQGNIVGLTCRVGRAVFGTISIIRDLLETGKSILLLGRPGVGKTTAIREIARVLADEMEKRVVIIDTSNEIAGDGDIPHPVIGRARRMQVTQPELQHQVMIEAVENHMPEVIIIDEIGTELESFAARTIAERGVQLVGTAHGNYLESLIKNPVLSDLVGGIQYVTLGDDEAKRRGTQKSILERKAAPAFEIAIEIHERTNWVIHEKVDNTVDQILQGAQSFIQRRILLKNGQVNILYQEIKTENQTGQVKWKKQEYSAVKELGQAGYNANDKMKKILISSVKNSLDNKESLSFNKSASGYLSIYAYGLNFSEIFAVIQTLQLPLVLSREVSKADVILALRSNLKQNTKLRQMASLRRITIYTIHSSSVIQITRALKKMLELNSVSFIKWSEFCSCKTEAEIEALSEAKHAIEKVIVYRKESVELLPRLADLRKVQHELVLFLNLKARSLGEEPCRRLRIYVN